MSRANAIEKKPLNNVRDSNLELFRIIVMFLIVAHHYVVNSGLIDSAGPIYSNMLSWRSIFLLIFGAWGKIGINCFVLISGYFMCTSKISAKKFVKLLGEVMFYRIIIQSIFWISGYSAFSLSAFVKAFIPVTSIGTGFTPAYLMFFLCIPFLNMLVNAMNEKQHIRLLLICLFTYVVLGNFRWFSVTMNYVSWFIVLYFIASYVRLYPKKIFSKTKVWGWLTVATVALSVLSIVASVLLGANWERRAYRFVTDSNALLALAVGFCSFMFFKNVKVKKCRFINAVGATTFGVFLIHANSNAMRTWLWKDTLNNVGMYDSFWMPVHAIASVIMIFVICSAIDYLRIRFVERPFFKLWDKKWDRISNWYMKTESKICKQLNIEENEK